VLIFEYTAVALIVGACSVFSAWRLLSARLRLQLLEFLSRLAGGGADATNSRWLRYLRRKTVAQLGGGCNACGSPEHRKSYAAAQPGRDVSATFRPVNRSSAAPHR
jgi:hypothetical protein